MLQTRPKKPCKHCGSQGHYPFQCFKKPKKPIPVEAPKTKRRRVNTATRWFKKNPPDENGHWLCYLRISALCPGTLTRPLVTLEHVYPKKTYPQFRYTIRNIKPACTFCNKLKGSRTIAQLAKVFPQVAALIETPAWHEWEARLQRWAVNRQARKVRDIFFDD
jgi:5-methylcytosine-specific restriction endonuclease McrA